MGGNPRRKGAAARGSREQSGGVRCSTPGAQGFGVGSQRGRPAAPAGRLRVGPALCAYTLRDPTLEGRLAGSGQSGAAVSHPGRPWGPCSQALAGMGGLRESRMGVSGR